MKTKIILLIFTVILTIPMVTQGQRWKRTRYEVVMGVGPSNFLGDLGGKNAEGTHSIGDLDMSTVRYGVMIGARYKIQELLAVKLNLIYGRVKGSDAYTTYEGRMNRGIEFVSPIFESTLQVEYSLLKERFGTRYTFQYLSRFSFRNVNTYVFTGVGGFYFNPSLNKIGITNKNEAYHHYNLAVPIGIGFKYGIDRRWCFGIELGQRFTSTDYIDGHSDIYSDARDSYGFLMFNLTYKLKTARSGLPKF